ncbi:MAG: hypothetical protein JOZ78_01940 [Chroococcidiopsidaceae cyanobacterium CP_BM_ER_R8_30]|nr:hypothetical protein [Chroococcidiopsidaceae cyanobacterium CP_BM_ER_R8_30]
MYHRKNCFPVWWSLSGPSGLTGASQGDLLMDYLLATNPVAPRPKVLKSHSQFLAKGVLELLLTRGE